MHTTHTGCFQVTFFFNLPVKKGKTHIKYSYVFFGIYDEQVLDINARFFITSYNTSILYAFKKCLKKRVNVYKFSHGVDLKRRNQYIKPNKNRKKIR